GGTAAVSTSAKNDSKSRAHLRRAGRRDRDGAAVAVARNPAPVDAKTQQAGAHMAREMVAPFGPVEAGSAEDAAALRRRREIKAELGKKAEPRGSHLAAVAVERDEAALRQRVG